MRKPIVLLLGAVSLAALANVACSRDRPTAQPGTTTVRSGEVQPPTVNVEEVRTVLLARKPMASDAINALVITHENGIVDLKGKVEDDATKADLINHVRAMAGVRGVRDNLVVQKEHAVGEAKDREKVGTTTTTGAEDMHATRADAVRHSMKKAHPMGEEVIKALTITEDGEIITVTGIVGDEETHKKLIKAAKETPGVKNVKDEIKVRKEATPAKAKGKTKDVKDTSKDAKDAAKQGAKDAKDATKQGAKDAKDAAKQGAEDAKDSVKDKPTEPKPADPKLNPVTP